MNVNATMNCVQSDSKETTLSLANNEHSHCLFFFFPIPPQYGNLTLAEDKDVGSTILIIRATDADEPFTGSSKILYRIIEGDSEGRLEVDTDPQTNVGYVKIKKVSILLNLSFLWINFLVIVQKQW